MKTLSELKEAIEKCDRRHGGSPYRYVGSNTEHADLLVIKKAAERLLAELERADQGEADPEVEFLAEIDEALKASEETLPTSPDVSDV